MSKPQPPSRWAQIRAKAGKRLLRPIDLQHLHGWTDAFLLIGIAVAARAVGFWSKPGGWLVIGLALIILGLQIEPPAEKPRRNV